jgi:hypothetical protein
MTNLNHPSYYPSPEDTEADKHPHLLDEGIEIKVDLEAKEPCVYCSNKAVFIWNGTPLCTTLECIIFNRHAWKVVNATRS